MIPPIPPSAATPGRPLPSQKTQVAPYGWLRRHGGIITAAAPLVSGGAAWAAGVIQGVDPIRAFKELGVPVAVIVLLAAALVWTFLVYIPQITAAAERTRQLLIEAQAAEIREIVSSHAEDRAAWLATQQAMQSTLHDLASSVREMGMRLGRLEEALGEAPTAPAAPAHKPGAQPGPRSTGGHAQLRPLGGGR